MSLQPLSERPREIAVNFNPALTAAVLWNSVSAYAESDENTGLAALSYPLLFLVLPLVLHESTLSAMPRDRRTRLQMWLSEHGEVLDGFAARASWLSQYTREGLIWGFACGVLALDAEGRIKTGSASVAEPPSEDHTAQVFAKAKLVGRWFAQVPDPAAIFQMLGVKP